MRPRLLRPIDFPWRTAIALSVGLTVWLALDPTILRFLP